MVSVAERGERAERRLVYTGYCGFVLIGWNSVIVPSVIRSIEHDFHQTDASFALFYFLSALVYACGSFGGGLLTERVGRGVVLPAAAVALGLGLVFQAFALSWPILLLTVVPVNLGAGAIDGGINGLFLDVFREARGGALNLLHVFFSVGAFVAPFVIGLLVGAGLTWRAIPLAAACCCIPVTYLLLGAALPPGRHSSTSVPKDETSTAASLVPFVGLAVSIGLCVAAEASVSSWVVRLLSGAPIALATGVLSIFWMGLTLGRLLSNRYADRFDYYNFTIACMLLSSVTLVAALYSPWLLLAALFFGLNGLFIGPIYPMIIALGGNIYSERLATLSGSLSAAAVVGSLVYPPLIGLMAQTIGIRGGMLGAALLGIPEIFGIVLARASANRVRTM